MMIGPNKSGRMRGEHHDRPAGLAVADHAGFAVGLRVQFRNLFQEHCFGARDILDRLARHRLRQEADEIAWVPGFKSDADLAVGLEAANTGAVAGARIDNDKWPARRIDLDAGRRDNPHKAVVDRLVELAAVDDEFDLIIEHVRSGFGQMLAILIAALPHHIPEQDAPLRGIDGVFDRGSKQIKRRRDRICRR